MKDEILQDSKTAVIDEIVTFIKKRELETFALMTLESFRPLHNIGAHALIFFEPFLTILFKQEKIENFREAMSDRRYFDYLLKKLDE